MQALIYTIALLFIHPRPKLITGSFQETVSPAINTRLFYKIVLRDISASFCCLNLRVIVVFGQSKQFDTTHDDKIFYSIVFKAWIKSLEAAWKLDLRSALGQC